MSTNTDIFSRIRSFMGFSRPEINPTNGFRNPIWGSEDDEDVDDELYHKEKLRESEDDQPSVKINIYSTDDPSDFHETLRNSMKEMVETFSNIFSNFKYHDSLPSDSYQVPLKEYFPKFKHMIPYWRQIFDSCQEPGYSNAVDGNRTDWDLDGKLSSNDVFDMLEKKDRQSYLEQNMPESKQMYKVVITSQWKKPDGTVETRKIVKDQNGVVEETTVSTPIHTAKEQHFIC